MAALTTTVIGAALLTGCSSDDADADAKEPAASSPAASAIPSAEEESSPAAYTTPDVCEDVKLEADSTISGKLLAACVVAAMEAYGTGTEYVLSSDQSGTTRFRFGDDPAMAGDIDATGGEKTSFVFLGDEEWLRTDGTWVKGDPDGDAGAMLVDSVGKAYRKLADPQVTADVIAASPTWKVESEKAVISLENGKDADAWRIVSVEPFDWNGAKMSEYIVWLEDDATPVGAQGTSTFGGVRDTTVQHFYDLGQPVTIEPPV
ncbi:hypothetical protein OG909_09685 [Streptomyces sp. NBC_01754]|uniref:hypothetical protein n=1 Tax=Streptomyces sp. NBC_01754 TaxID=2975930 RepID=UPI002DD87277|nr:hypothetical protein [Streptomyces sp. NBC_01754]WSC92543.1 hypothetical protein OG909_09685 [Streptomyces sp. NBC_01754]